MRRVAVVVILLAACSGKPRTPPHILLITLDTTRADHIGAYGFRQGRTPALDTLAAGGVLFERTVAAAPITLPSHTSLLTGLYPFAHGVRNNGTFRVRDDLPTLATVLKARGYRTGAFVSAFVLDRRFGLSRGFDEYDDHLESSGGRIVNGELERRGDRTGDAAAAWLERTVAAGGPFFLWLHLYDAHDPYDPPSPFAAAFGDRPYDGEIAFQDSVVAAMLARLDRLGVATSTIVAAVGDHGEGLGEHDEETHAMFVYESALRVPMILRWPGHLPAGTRVASLARTIDLAPTLLDLAGAPPFARADGGSLVPALRDRAKGPTAAYAETYFPQLYMNWAPLRSIQDERWKFIDAPTPELYDLSSDAAERTNLAARESGRAAALKRALDAATGPGAGAAAEAPLDRSAREKLAALGYIGAATDRPPLSAQGLADPKEKIGVFNRLRRANAALQAKRYGEAEGASRAVLASDRTNAFAVVTLARAEMAQGRYRDAIRDFQLYATLVPASADAHHWIAICQSRVGDIDRALAEVDAALAIDPRFDNALILRAGLLAEKGRTAEAIAALKRAIEIQPANADAHANYGALLALQGARDRAMQELERALALRPDDREVRALYERLRSAR